MTAQTPWLAQVSRAWWMADSARHRFELLIKRRGGIDPRHRRGAQRPADPLCRLWIYIQPPRFLPYGFSGKAQSAPEALTDCSGPTCRGDRRAREMYLLYMKKGEGQNRREIKAPPHPTPPVPQTNSAQVSAKRSRQVSASRWSLPPGEAIHGGVGLALS